MTTATKIALVSTVIGAAISTMILVVGLQHNPQGEFYTVPEDGGVRWAYTVGFFGLWFLSTSIGSGILTTAIWLLASAVKRHMSKNTH